MSHPIPLAKDAVKALLVALPAFAAVDVRDDIPADLDSVTNDMFWFNETEIPVDGWAWLGGQRRRVTFQLGFTLAVIRDDGSSRGTEDVVWSYLEALMLALKGDPTLSGAIQQVEDMSGTESTAALPSQWQARFDGRISCISKPY